MSEKTTSYEQMMFADYPDIVGICDLQKMLGIGRKAALELAKHLLQITNADDVGIVRKHHLFVTGRVFTHKRFSFHYVM